MSISSQTHGRGEGKDSRHGRWTWVHQQPNRSATSVPAIQQCIISSSSRLGAMHSATRVNDGQCHTLQHHALVAAQEHHQQCHSPQPACTWPTPRRNTNIQHIYVLYARTIRACARRSRGYAPKGTRSGALYAHGVRTQTHICVCVLRVR